MAGKVLLVDLGGGSCEITLSDRKRIKETSASRSAPSASRRISFPSTRRLKTAWPACADGLAANCAVPTAEFSLPAQSCHRYSGTAAALCEACALEGTKIAGKSAGQRAAKAAKLRPGASASISLSTQMAPTKYVRKLATAWRR